MLPSDGFFLYSVYTLRLQISDNDKKVFQISNTYSQKRKKNEINHSKQTRFGKENNDLTKVD
jgi:hypothetical protein